MPTAAAPPGPRAQRTAARREALLAAALACFTEKGYEATAIGDIRRVSGASTGSIYHHFPDKAGLASALYVTLLEGYQHETMAMLERHPEAEAGIRAGVRHHLAWIRDHPREARFTIDGPPAAVAHSTAATLEPVNLQFFSALDAWVKPHVAAGALRELPRGVMQALWIGPAQAYAREWLLTGGSARALRAATDALADAAWRSLGA